MSLKIQRSEQPCLDQIETIDKGINEPDGNVGADMVVDGFWEKQKLRAFKAGNVRYAEIYRAKPKKLNPSLIISTNFRTVCIILH